VAPGILEKVARAVGVHRCGAALQGGQLSLDPGQTRLRKVIRQTSVNIHDAVPVRLSGDLRHVRSPVRFSDRNDPARKGKWREKLQIDCRRARIRV
jgi:hypothetical protein